MYWQFARSPFVYLLNKAQKKLPVCVALKLEKFPVGMDRALQAFEMTLAGKKNNHWLPHLLTITSREIRSNKMDKGQIIRNKVIRPK